MEKVILDKLQEETLKKSQEVLETYIKEGQMGTISKNMAIASWTIINNYLQAYFFCREGYQCVGIRNGIGGTQQVYKKVYGKQTKSLTQSQIFILETCNAIKEMLLDKNRKYGDSALNPQRIFSRADPIEQINIRIDDKLSRIKSGQFDEDEDVEEDLLGYLILKKVAQKIRAKENEIRIDEEVNKRGG